MVRRGRRVVLAATSPARVGRTPGSRLQPGGEIRPSRAVCPKSLAEGKTGGPPQSVNAIASSAKRRRTRRTHAGHGWIYRSDNYGNHGGGCGDILSIEQLGPGASPAESPAALAATPYRLFLVKRRRIPQTDGKQLWILSERDLPTGPGRIPVAGNQGHNFVVDAHLQDYFLHIQRENPMELVKERGY